MADVKFEAIPANSYVQSADNTHYNLPLIPWFRSTGQPSDYPNEFVPDIGTKHTFVSNIDPSTYNYIYNKTDPFWPKEGNFDNGFSIQSPRVSSHRQFNYRISGGKGHWIPCPIFKTVSFYWSKEGGGGAWYIKHFALVLRNVKTDEEKIWGAGLNNTNGNSRIMKITETNEVRAMGPDWFVYGVIFNLVRPQTSDLNEPKARLVDFRLGYLCNGLGAGSYRVIVPKQMTWGNFLSAYRSGQMKYETSSPLLKDTKRLNDDPWTINATTFTPSNSPTGGLYNKWVGNCQSIWMNPFGGVDLFDYIGTHSDAEIVITRSDNDALVFKGNITEISQATAEAANLSVTKIETGGGEWVPNLDMNIVITGLY